MCKVLLKGIFDYMKGSLKNPTLWTHLNEQKNVIPKYFNTTNYSIFAEGDYYFSVKLLPLSIENVKK